MKLTKRSLNIFFILISTFLFSCTSELEVELVKSDNNLKTTNLTIQGGINGFEKVIVLEYEGLDSLKANNCDVSNLKNLNETTACSCNDNGICTVGVTPPSSFSGLASFDYIVTDGENVSNKAKTNINVKLIEIYAGQLSNDHFLGLDVHWNSKTVLLATESGDRCIHAVDIDDLSNPVLFNTLGMSTTPATNADNCRDVRITEDGTKFIVPGNNKYTEVWTFGGNSKDPNTWSELSQLFTSTKKPKRLSQLFDNGASYDFVLSSQGGLLKATLNKTTDAITINNTGTNAYDTTHSISYQDGVYINDDLIIATEPGYNQPIKVYANNSGIIKTIALDNASNYMWSSAASSDQTKIAIGGGRLALLSYDGLQADADKVQLEYQEALSASMRHMVFFEYQSSSYLAGALSDGSISIYNVDQLDSPQLIVNHKISAFDGEAYDLKVIESDEVIIVAGTKGKFAILNIPGLL